MICGSLWQSWQATPSLSHGTDILPHGCILLLHAYLHVTYAQGLTFVQTSQHCLWRQSGQPYNMFVILDCNVQVQELEMKSAQQDAELAAAKQKWATHLAAHQDSERVRPVKCFHIGLQDLESIQASRKVNIHQQSALHVQ